MRTPHRQCELWKGNSYTIEWVPSEKAKVGNIVDGWKITAVYQEMDRAPNIVKAIRTHRTNTGDSLPKKT